MTASALSTVERSTLVRAPRSRVWQALTNIQEFSKWFCVEAAGEFTPGARLNMISTHECGKGQKFFVDVVKMEAPETFSWRWSPGSKRPGEDTSSEPLTVVEFRLAEVEGGTLVTVTESGFDGLSLARRTRVFEENDKGWQIQLASLTQYAGEGA
jgi:uncharacterized protein YndB with AHSA1/START domain